MPTAKNVVAHLPKSLGWSLRGGLTVERLTEQCPEGIRIKGCSTLYADKERKGTPASNAIVRLAAYEDTDLEPEERHKMKSIYFPSPVADEMVRAIMEGRKTVTRRAVRPQPNMFTLRSGIKMPYRPGSVLYVRETWRVQSARRFGADARIEFKAGGNMVKIQFPGCDDQYHNRREYDAFVTRWADDRWHPSIHMPREAARIFLRVTDVRVEKLQNITETDMLREGVITRQLLNDFEEFISRKAFALLWDSTIKPADRALYGWEANPYVWKIEFERCEKPKGD